MRRTVLCAAAVLALLTAPALAAAATDGAGFAPPAVPDTARDVAGGPLDLRAVTFGQRGTRMLLDIRTQDAWNAGQLAEHGLCLTLLRERAVGRLCVGADRGAAVPRYRRIGRTGIAGRARPVAAVLVREDARSLTATLHPRAIGLARGAVRWILESRWNDAGACWAACIDRVPDRGHRAARVSLLAQPRCFGAAARAGGRRCANPALRRAVIPNPADAVLLPDAACQVVPDRLRSALLHPCQFGDLQGDRAPDAALIGDSHTAHWRAAVDVAADARGWRALSMTRPGCAFSSEAYPAPAPIPANCRRHSSEALRWLRAHPSVHTVLTSSSAGRGFSVGGFLDMWRRVPRSVRRIYVIRDVPRVTAFTRSCVLAVLRRRRPSAGTCAVPRRSAVLADPAAAAATTRASGRVRLVDLTRHFCDAARCFPVVGGAYVYKDDNHMNTVFSASLGPFLLRRLR